MSKPQLTPDQLSALLSFAAARLGVSEAELAKTVQTGDTAALGLSADKTAQIDALLRDRATVEKLINTPAAQTLLQNLGKGDTNGHL